MARKDVRAGRGIQQEKSLVQEDLAKKKTVHEVKNVLMTKDSTSQNQRNVNLPGSATLFLQQLHRYASSSRLSLCRLNVLVQQRSRQLYAVGGK